MAWSNDIQIPSVRLISVEQRVDKAIAIVGGGKERSHRGRPTQIVTPADIRWPVVQEFLRSSNLSENSRKLYERELKRFLGWTQCAWTDLKLRHLGLYKAYLMELEVSEGKQLSKNSLNSALTALKSFFKWLCQFHPELCSVNPTDGVKFEKVPLPPAQSLTLEEMERVWSAIAQRRETRLRDLALVQLLSHNLRAGEVVAANVGSFDGRLVTITQTKNKKPRLVPLSQAGQQAIQDYLEARREQGESVSSESALILSHHQGWEGDRLSYHGIYFAVERIGELAQLPELHPHQFRHTGATNLLRMGLDPAHAMRLTGHEDGRSFRRYTLAYEQEGAIDAFYRAEAEGKNEQVVYAKGLSRQQRQLLTALAEATGKPPLYQDDLDKGEIEFAQLWNENVAYLERMVADVRQLPKKLGVTVEIKQSSKAVESPEPLKEAIINLWLRVENNNKFIRRKTKVRKEIENYCLARYKVQKIRPDGYDYVLKIPYEDEANLEWEIHWLCAEMHDIADQDYCFLEMDLREEGTERHW